MHLAGIMLAAFAAIAMAGTASAQNINAFRDVPISRLSAPELKEYLAFLNKTLESTPEGTTAEWKAPKTPFTGKVTPLKSYTEAGLHCREATIDSEAHDLHQRGRYTLCKNPKGVWQFKSPAPAAQGKKPQ
jgi:surface antigen